MSRSDQLEVTDSSRRSVAGGLWRFLAKARSLRFFTLSSLPQVEQASLKNSTTPEKMFSASARSSFRLSRSEIVVRSAQNRFDVSQNDRWAEPLEKNFSRVLSAKSCAAPEHGSDRNPSMVTRQSAALPGRNRSAPF